MPLNIIDIHIAGLSAEHLKTLEDREEAGFLDIVPAREANEPGIAATAIQCVGDNLPFVLVMCAAWRLKLSLTVNRRNGTKAEFKLAFDKEKVDPKTVAAVLREAAGTSASGG